MAQADRTKLRVECKPLSVDLRSDNVELKRVRRFHKTFEGIYSDFGKKRSILIEGNFRIVRHGRGAKQDWNYSGLKSVRSAFERIKQIR